MVAFEAKHAGEAASLLYKNYGFKNVSYGTKFFNYTDFAEGSAYHYQIIKAASIAKLMQNPEAYKLLLKTKGLILKPDHFVGDNVPQSFRYFEIMMEIRDQENLGPQ
jgi:hypothetical protein